MVSRGMKGKKKQEWIDPERRGGGGEREREREREKEREKREKGWSFTMCSLGTFAT